ncbi:SigE family RNA polymerase sigma factor [Streptomyces sp. ISL-87]|nr:MULTISPECIES: SigE family RNA polymerase sigma factor [unclassified Streptomyces]MBT2402164.1 SigE family RNA polymerase sigma factor [Streptomyces sp. ISL-21]MBT2453632.1 SigE family RNA polymerase sigma factor [Streptomyces sp. ISL-86]MBT2609350.1 SigE family RNA polymerase sigma factor [Streptomyces sp. ISL-87]
MAEALLDIAVVPARFGIIPSRRRSPVLGGFPVIVPVPPAGASPVAPPSAVPTRGGRVPSPRDSADTAGSSAAAATAEKAVVAGTTVDHLTETYQAHYRSLLGLAALLLDDTASCEDVVQEAFIRVHSARNRVRDRDKTLAYLRQTVVNLSRSALRRRILGLKLLSKPMPDMASAEEGAYDQLERDDLIKAMRGLQRRQREVLVLRYFADMTEAQVAETLGISLGSVKAYGSRGIAALRVAMEAAQS